MENSGVQSRIYDQFSECKNMKKATNTTKYTTFFQHKTGRAVIVYANLKIGFYDLHKNRKKNIPFPPHKRNISYFCR